jgi:penicillin-binding protein 1A
MANSYEMLVNARRLRDLPLERDAVGALCGHGFHPLKAQLKVQRLPVLALSQVTTAPEAVATRFDRVANQVHVAQLLRAGCAYMRKAFDIEDINLDELIATAMDDPQAIGESKAFHGINFADLLTAYREFCKNEQVPIPAVDLGEVIDFYNKALKDLPDHIKLKGLKLPGESVVLDRRGERFAEVFEENQRRIWVVLADIPEHVQKAFIAAEDKRFFEHKGIDERGLIRAFISNLAHSSRPQGGSTIIQQVVKNLLVGDDLTYERKIREMVVASRVERALSKAEILELYLNSIYLGRGAWGIELAARSYFGKPAKDLTLQEGALLAGADQGSQLFLSRPASRTGAGAACLCVGPAARVRGDCPHAGGPGLAGATDHGGLRTPAAGYWLSLC